MTFLLTSKPPMQCTARYHSRFGDLISNFKKWSQQPDTIIIWWRGLRHWQSFSSFHFVKTIHDYRSICKKQDDLRERFLDFYLQKSTGVRKNNWVSCDKKTLFGVLGLTSARFVAVNGLILTHLSDAEDKSPEFHKFPLVAVLPLRCAVRTTHDNCRENSFYGSSEVSFTKFRKL